MLSHCKTSARHSVCITQHVFSIIEAERRVSNSICRCDRGGPIGGQPRHAQHEPLCSDSTVISRLSHARCAGSNLIYTHALSLSCTYCSKLNLPTRHSCRGVEVHNLSAMSLRLVAEDWYFQRVPATAPPSHAGAVGRGVATTAATFERGGGSNKLMKFLQQDVSI